MLSTAFKTCPTKIILTQARHKLYFACTSPTQRQIAVYSGLYCSLPANTIQYMGIL
jgi:hypothetical protein